MNEKIRPDEKTLDTIEGLAKIQCTQGEAAGVLGVTRQTFIAFLDRHPVARNRWEAGLESGKASLRRNQFKMAQTNAAMAIWLGKQYLGQREPVRDDVGPAPEPPLGKKEQALRSAETAHEGNEWGNLLN